MADFKKKYLKEGTAVFSEANVVMLRQIQRKYADEYAPFFFKLADSVGSNEVGDDLANCGQAAQQIVRDIGLMLDKSRMVAAPDIDRFFENIKYLKGKANFYTKEMKRDKIFGDRVRQIEKEQDISFKNLANAHSIIEKQAKSMGHGKGMFGDTKEFLKEHAPEAYGLGSEIAGGLATAVLGPFAGMAKTAYGTGVGIFKGIRERRIAKQQRKLAEELLPASMRTPEKVVSNYRAMMEKGTPLGGIFKDYGLSSFVDDGGMARGRNTGVSAVARGLGAAGMAGMATGAIGVTGLTDSLFLFFNKLAYKAAWTKEVLEALRGKAASSGGGGGFFGVFGGLGKIFSGLMKWIPAVALMLGGLAAAYAGIKWATSLIPANLKRAQQEGWFGKAGAPLSLGGKTAASAGTIIGGGKGFGEKGQTLWGAFGNTLKGTGKGVLIGGGIGATLGGILGGIGGSVVPGAGTAAGAWAGGLAGAKLGALIGGGIGTLGHALGARRVSKGLYHGFGLSTVGTPINMISQMNRAGDIFGLEKGQKASIGQRFAAGIGAIGSSLSFGKWTPDDIARAVHKPFEKSTEVKTSRDMERIPTGIAADVAMSAKLSEMNDIMRSSLGEFVNSFKKTLPSSTTMPSSAKEDIYGNRDPGLDGINSGILGLDMM